MLTGSDDGEAAAAAEQARELRARLTTFYDQAADGRISPSGLARIEARLLEQIKTTERRAHPRGLPSVVSELASPEAAASWHSLSVPQRREVIRALLVPRIHLSGKGTRIFNPDRIEIIWRTGHPL